MNLALGNLQCNADKDLAKQAAENMSLGANQVIKLRRKLVYYSGNLRRRFLAIQI